MWAGGRIRTGGGRPRASRHLAAPTRLASALAPTKAPRVACLGPALRLWRASNPPTAPGPSLSLTKAAPVRAGSRGGRNVLRSADALRLCRLPSPSHVFLLHPPPGRAEARGHLPPSYAIIMGLIIQRLCDVHNTCRAAAGLLPPIYSQDRPAAPLRPHTTQALYLPGGAGPLWSWRRLARGPPAQSSGGGSPRRRPALAVMEAGFGLVVGPI